MEGNEPNGDRPDSSRPWSWPWQVKLTILLYGLMVYVALWHEANWMFDEWWIFLVDLLKRITGQP